MFSVAIDGPTGAGKSTVAKALAKELGFIYVDTGALYRAIGFRALSLGVDVYDKEAVEILLKEIVISIEYIGAVQHVFVNSKDVTDDIRTERVSMAASAVSAHPAVRIYLLELQRSFADTSNVIMDGRDIGTVVLPKADVKIFLTASSEERAERRFKELKAKGIEVDYDEVLSDLVKRDHNDSNRDIAPLKAAEDAFTIDSTDKGFNEVVGNILDIIREIRKA